VGDAAVEREPGVVAVVDPVPGIMGIGGPRADLDVRGEARAAVGAERPPELGVIVRGPTLWVGDTGTFWLADVRARPDFGGVRVLYLTPAEGKVTK
jgi:hypothetical protein